MVSLPSLYLFGRRVNEMKYLIECMDEEGNWRKFNYYEGTLFDLKAKMARIIEKTNYVGIKCSLV